MADKDSFLYKAKLAEQAERYDEMVDSMKSIAKLDPNLNTEERNLLSVGYKNVIGTRRASWRVVTAIEGKEKDQADKMAVIKAYREQIEKELTEICDDILNLLTNTLIPSVKAEDVEAKVFYYKMKGDYYRYMSEILPEGDQKGSSGDNALTAYQEARKVAEGLEPMHPIRLGLALNFSVFYYEILNLPKEAKALAQSAFEDAVKELSTKTENSDYKDSTLILQLLRDNLTLWNTDEQDEGDRPGPVEDLEDQ